MPYVRPDVQTVLDMLAAQPGPKMEESDPAVARQMMRMMGQLTERPRGDLAEVKDFTIPTPHGHDVPARLYRAVKSDAPAPLMIFYHGGGWVIGDLETHDPLCAEIARTLGMTVLSVDYRLAPEHKFPAATEDCLAVTEWAARSPAEIGHRVTGIVPAGDSAGGNLAAVVSQQLHGRLAYPILAQWLIYPGVDMGATGGSMEEFSEGYLLTEAAMVWFMNHYAPEPGHAYASPLHHEAFEGQPPALVFTCGLDPLRDQGRAYGAKLVRNGVRTIFREAAGQIHGSFNLRAAIPSAQEDLLACLKDLKLLLDESIAAQAPAASLRQAAE